MSATSGDDIPVLTDILSPGRRIAAAVVAALASPAATSVSAVAPVTRVSESDWEHLERDVRETVLKGLQARIDVVLEQRLRETLSILLEQVLAGMTSELKASLRDTMRDVVGRAVAQEISRLRAARVN